MATCATTLPLLPETFEYSHGMRFWQADVLRVLGNKYNVSHWTETSILFRQSGKEIMKLCEAALEQDKQEVSSVLMEVADIEERAYVRLKDME